MQHVVVGFLAILSICAARPVQDEAPASLESGSPSLGFLPRDLPSAAAAIPLSSAGNLTFPLNPQDEHGIGTRYSTDSRRGFPPKGGELVMSLAIEIYWYWRDTSNVPIEHQISRYGEAPFRNFVYIIAPATNPRAILNPYKVGIGYCWTLINVLMHGSAWPSHITNYIYNRLDGRTVGTLSVENRGRAGDSGSSVAPNSKQLERIFWPNSTFNSISLPGHSSVLKGTNYATVERRWFGCLASMLMLIIVQPMNNLVTEMLQPGRHGVTFHYACTLQGTSTTKRDMIHITVYAAAASKRLTWKVLVEELLLFGSGVALGNPYESSGAVKDGDTLLAVIKFELEKLSVPNIGTA